MTVGAVALGDDLVVSAQGFGAMGLSHVYGHADRESSLATLHHAIDAGARFVDTADIYGQGANEELVGEVLATRRDDVVLATKFGFLPEPDADGLRVNGSPDYARAALDRSLTRLGVDRVDLYYYHRVDPRVPIEATVAALADLVAQGVVGHIGLSEVTADELERAASVHPIAAVQSEWSVWSRDIEARVVPTAARLGVGIVAYAPLGRGFLAGPLGELDAADNRRNFPRFDPEARRVNEAIAARVDELARRTGVTRAQLALAWQAAKARELGVASVAIPGTRRAERVDENLAALHVEPTADTLHELDTLAAHAVGDRARDALTISQGRERAQGVVR